MSATTQAIDSKADENILGSLTELFRDLFADSAIRLQPETTAEDIPGWDSMAQVTMAVEIEHRFNIKIKSAEMEELRVVGDLVALIRSRLPAVAR